MRAPSILPSASRIFSYPTAMPTLPSPSSNFRMTESTAVPPEAQAFSTDSIDLPPRPGTDATRPASRPCSLREILQAPATDPTSITEGGTSICLHTAFTAFGENVRHLHVHELAEFRLVVSCDVNWGIHVNPFSGKKLELHRLQVRADGQRGLGGPPHIIHAELWRDLFQHESLAGHDLHVCHFRYDRIDH